LTSLEVLKKYWGYAHFRPPQEEIISTFLKGKDVVAILPTGAGKSVCFQVSSLMKEGVCVVVTPLIALMQDQVQQLKNRGIPAVAIHAGMNRTAIDITLDNCVYGKEKFLYVSPERLQTEIFRERVKKMNVNLIAIDEAHCISQWGYDFRPAYLKIADLHELKPGIPFMALTGSATGQVRDEITEKLQLKNPVLFQQSFSRQHLSLVVRKTETKEQKLLEILGKVPGPAILYVRSRKATEQLSKYLVRNKIPSTFYHAGLTTQERIARQQAWIESQVRVMVATNAFGMGINKADVRVVVHLDLPENIESYYQEAGRAGRDGRRSYATLIYRDADLAALRSKTELAQPALDYLNKIYQALANFFQLAIGSSQGEAYDFNLDDFSKKFNLKPAAVHPALKKLEEFGLVQLNDGFHRPSRLHFSIDKKRIYEFQVANARFDPIIKTLLRFYGAELFSDFVVISEGHLANALKLTVPEVKLEIQKLHRLQLLVYEEASDSPQIVFILPRQDAQHLPIDKKEMDRRRKLHLDKMEAMISYAQQSDRCRMQWVQAYFNEITQETCGICDVCIDKRRKENTDLVKDYSDQIIYLLSEGPMGVDELETAVAARDKELFAEVVRELVDGGTIAYDQHWVLHKK